MWKVRFGTGVSKLGALIITVDGLSFTNTFLRPNKPLPDNDNYLETALKSMNHGVPNEDIKAFNWSPRDATQTKQVIKNLREKLREYFTEAQNKGKKFIVISHSWGTFLTHLALSYESAAIEPFFCDLYITLGSPLGTRNELPDVIIPIPTPFGFIPIPTFPIPASLMAWIEIGNYVSKWLRDLNFVSCDNCDPRGYPRVDRYINFWARGDLLSGPLGGNFMPLAENIRVDEPPFNTVRNTERTISSTIDWHKYDSLQPGGSIDNKLLKGSVDRLIIETLHR